MKCSNCVKIVSMISCWKYYVMDHRNFHNIYNDGVGEKKDNDDDFFFRTWIPFWYYRKFDSRTRRKTLRCFLLPAPIRLFFVISKNCTSKSDYERCFQIQFSNRTDLYYLRSDNVSNSILLVNMYVYKIYILIEFYFLFSI